MKQMGTHGVALRHVSASSDFIVKPFDVAYKSSLEDGRPRWRKLLMSIVHVWLATSVRWNVTSAVLVRGRTLGVRVCWMGRVGGAMPARRVAVCSRPTEKHNM